LLNPFSSAGSHFDVKRWQNPLEGDERVDGLGPDGTAAAPSRSRVHGEQLSTGVHFLGVDHRAPSKRVSSCLPGVSGVSVVVHDHLEAVSAGTSSSVSNEIPGVDAVTASNVRVTAARVQQLDFLFVGHTGVVADLCDLNFDPGGEHRPVTLLDFDVEGERIALTVQAHFLAVGEKSGGHWSILLLKALGSGSHHDEMRLLAARVPVNRVSPSASLERKYHIVNLSCNFEKAKI